MVPIKGRGLRLLTVPLFLLPLVLTACSNPEEEASQAFAALEAEYEAAQEALSEEQESLPELSEDPDSTERTARREMMDSMNAKFEAMTESFLPRFAALAQEHWGTGAGLEAKLWALSRADRPDMDAEAEEREAAEEAREAKIAEEAEAILAEYGETPHMEKVVEFSYMLPDEMADEYLAQLRENSPHANVRAAAIYYPANRRLSQLRMKEQFPGLAEDEGDAEAEETADPGEDVDPRVAVNADLQLLIDEYGDVPMGGTTYGAVAYAHLTSHTAEELAIGQPAPEILGTNVDGEEMRLSDFKGKVVVIDFWGDW